MDSNTNHSSLFAGKIQEVENRLENLKQEIAEIGMPAASELGRRLDILKIEEKALKRNIDESIHTKQADDGSLAKIEKLLAHIEREENSMKREADFLNQSVPSSMSLVAETGAHIAELLKKGVEHVVGDHRPLGSSIFVNHSHENLVKYHGLEEVNPDPSSGSSK
jgi:chromosome segregation ATPase